MICQTYSFYVLSVIMIYFAHFGNSFKLATLQDDIDQLKADFNASLSDVGDGGPIFTDKLKNWTEKNEKGIILSQILTIYLKILEKTDKSKKHVRNLSEELIALKEEHSDGLQKMEYLMNLAELQTGDLKIQRKAVHEMFSVLQKLVETPASHKRKRSQKRCKC